MFLKQTLQLGPLIIKINWLVVAFVLILITVLVRLGLWQLDRAAEKTALVNQTSSLQSQAPRPFEGLFNGEISSGEEDLSTVNLSLTGEFINEKSIWVANQTYEEQIGYEVLTPFRLQSNGKLVLVSRGWVTARAYDNPAQFVKPISELTDLTGLLVTKPFTFEQKNKLDIGTWPLRIAHVDTQEISNILGEPIFPYVVRLNEDSPGILIRHWKNVVVNIDKNYSYALQWFAMAIAVFLASIYLSSNLGNLIKPAKL